MRLLLAATAASLLAEAAKDSSQATAPTAKRACSNVFENCNETGCCADDSLKCFEKTSRWAECVTDCQTLQGNERWSCREIDERKIRCSPEGESCAASECCRDSDVGVSCYQQDSTEAICLRSCDRDGWTCKRLDGCRSAYQQCGGLGYLGPACCERGCLCSDVDKDGSSYRMCMPEEEGAPECDREETLYFSTAGAAGGGGPGGGAPAAARAAPAAAALLAALGALLGLARRARGPAGPFRPVAVESGDSAT